MAGWLWAGDSKSASQACFRVAESSLATEAERADKRLFEAGPAGVVRSGAAGVDVVAGVVLGGTAADAGDAEVITGVSPVVQPNNAASKIPLTSEVGAVDGWLI